MSTGSPGALVPLATHNGRIAASAVPAGSQDAVRVQLSQSVFRPTGLARTVQFTVPRSNDGLLLGGIDPDFVYELRERYNNTEAK
jgi:hypothetical protein